MCYSTRITRKAEELEKHYLVTKLLGDRVLEEELVYNHANGFSHPLLWIIPQEESTHITPSLWGIIPSNKLGSDKALL
jgi:hypothetical protein